MTDIDTQITALDTKIRNLMGSRERLVTEREFGVRKQPTLQQIRALFDDDMYSTSHNARTYNQRVVYSLLARKFTDKSQIQIGKMIGRDASTISRYLRIANERHQDRAAVYALQIQAENRTAGLEQQSGTAGPDHTARAVRKAEARSETGVRAV